MFTRLTISSGLETIYPDWNYFIRIGNYFIRIRNYFIRIGAISSICMVTSTKEAGVTATFFLNTRSLVEADQGHCDEPRRIEYNRIE